MKGIFISIGISLAIIGGAVLVSGGIRQSVADEVVKNNVSVVDGKQIIEIDAKGGYNPRITLAKADVPTILRMKTQGSFDCSSAVAIPALGYRVNLPPSGTTDIPIPVQKSGTTLQGLCAMGMYNFQVLFN